MAQMALLTVLAVLVSATGEARFGELTGEQVQTAIAKAIRFITSQQSADGTWPDYGRPGGITCLAALALLTGGVPETDPALAKALPKIAALPNRETYVVGLKAMALAAANPVKYRPELVGCAAWLVDAQVKTGPFEGMWRYTARETSGDNSNTQYAVLGLDACARAGVPIDRQVWNRILRHFRGSQNPDGGWAYTPGQGPSYGSMSSAGLAGLHLAGARLDADFDAHVCGRYRQDPALAAGINWFARNFSVNTNPPNHGQAYLYYYLYGLERVGMVSSRKYLGAHHWYREGAAELVRTQAPNGAWGPGAAVPLLGRGLNAQATMNTAFGLLFLAKGRAPVLIQKLQWAGDWNNDPYDVDRLVRFVGAEWKHPLSWQFVSIGDRVEDLLDAPVLFLNGHTAPVFTPAEKERLRDFIDQGGFLLAEACCGAAPFDAAFRDLVRELFPDPEWKLRRLPDDHPVYTAYYKWTGARFLEGIDIHCRTAVVYVPQDLSCAWHQDRPEDLGAFKLGANLCAYATGLEPLKDKLETVSVVKVHEVVDGSARRGALVVGKIRHNGQWNMDALAIPRLLSDMTRNANLTIFTRPHPLALTDKDLYDYPLLYISGAYTFTLSDEEKARLREYLKRGGVLFGNSLTGKPAFDKAFRALIQDLFPEQELKPLPLDHPVYSSGYTIEKVSYTKAVRDEHPDLDTPSLEGLTFDNRTVVFYSKYDIGCALDAGVVLQGKGYLRKCAFRLATNIVLYALSF
jgi:hypothetical protein